MAKNSQWRLLAVSDAANKYLQRTYTLKQGENRIGRSSKIEIPIPSMRCSRNHCTISVRDNEITLIDTSRNGTYVNETLIRNRQFKGIKHNDIIAFGFNISGTYDPSDKKAFIYIIHYDCVDSIEIEDSDDETMDYKSNETVQNESKSEVIIRVDTQPMVPNPFAMHYQQQQQQQQFMENQRFPSPQPSTSSNWYSLPS